MWIVHRSGKMKITWGILLPQLLQLLLWQQANGANVLCIVGTAAHNNPGWIQPFLEALAGRGHQLTVYTTKVSEAPIPNMEQIPLTNDYDILNKHYVNSLGYYQRSWDIKHLLIWYEALLGTCRSTIESEVFNNFQLPDVNFDLIIYDATYSLECLVTKLTGYQAVPMLGLSGGKLTKDVIQLVQAENTISPVTIPHFVSQLPLEMTYWNRVQNHALYFAEKFIKWAVVQPILNGMMGKDYHNPGAQLVLLNTHPSLDYVQNMPPNIIEVGGLHIRAESESLPFSTKEFIQRFTAGVVLINLPHLDLMYGKGLEAIEQMVKSFDQFGFLWNLNGSKPSALDNTYNLRTISLTNNMQQNILAQSNVKVFLTHGDSFSIQEAIYNAVPIIVLPLLMDQINNAQRLVERHLGVRVSTRDFDVDSFSEALKTLIRDDEYVDMVRQTQLNFRTRAVKPVDTAVWYAEQMISQPDLFSYLSVRETSGHFYLTRKSMEVLILPLLFISYFCVNVFLLIWKNVTKYGKIKYKNQKNQMDKEIQGIGTARNKQD